MSVLAIPCFTSPFFSEVTTLEGTTFLLSFAYAQREACWYVSLADANGVDIYNGIKLTVGQLLLKKCVDPRRPPGELIVMSSTNDLSPPGLNDLIASGRCTLFYVTSDLVAMVLNGTIGAYLASLTTNTAQGQQSTYGSM